ncbi:MAG: M56 family metallopeptidase, partial [Lachnospiraceae bacterium]|nr:M56 family metallopeptidase [Lachnospiraceae bacterium]
MVETVLITTILLAVFLCLRKMLDGKISAGLQYGVWLLIALRLLLVWIPLPGSSVSVINLIPVVQDSFQSWNQNIFGEKTEKAGGDAERNLVSQTNHALSQNDAMAKDTATDQNVQIGTNVQSEGEQALESESKSASSIGGIASVADSLPILLYRIYWICAVLVLLWIIAKNIWLWRGLCRRRVRYEGQLPVASLPGNLYLVDHLKSPFLFGKHIYVSPEMLSDQQKLQYILVHETCHWKQGDSFWSVLRCLCLAGYWYHPLVWHSVHLSIEDAELACDEKVIRVLGEESRCGYGETLLGLIRKRTAFLECTCMSTQMSGNKQETKKRLERIVEQGKRRKGRILFLVVSMLVLCMATLPGKKMAKYTVTEKEWKMVEQEG